MQQQLGQTSHSYMFELQTLWDRLASCDLAWPNTKAAKVYADFRDNQRV